MGCGKIQSGRGSGLGRRRVYKRDMFTAFVGQAIPVQGTARGSSSVRAPEQSPRT